MKKILICMTVLLTTGFNTIRAEKETPAADVINNKISLVQKQPQAGRIIKNVPSTQGFTRYTLSNGVTVLFHKDTQNTNEVTMYALSNGGTSLYPDLLPANQKALNECLAVSGLGSFSESELHQILAGHKVSVTPYIGLYGEFISSSAAPKDLETMFQLNHMYFTSLRTDLDAFNTWREHKRQEIANHKESPAVSITNKELDLINYDLVMQVVAQRFGNAGDFTFVITGNISEDVLIPLLEQYIASLPTSKKHEHANYHAYDTTSRIS